MASKATRALNAGEWLRLGRFIDDTPPVVGKYSSDSTEGGLPGSTTELRKITMNLRWTMLIAGAVLMAIVAIKVFSPPAAEHVKIGFLVKMPEQAWFINEIAAAKGAGREQDFDVIAMGTPDGERLMTAIDNLAAQGAQGFVVCAPDVRLGPAVVARSRVARLKVLTVDDQFRGPDGKPLTDAPHLGMSGYKIGLQVGQAIVAEMRRRHWNATDVGAIELTNNELPTAVERVSGARDALLQGGFERANIFEAPQRATDTEAASNAASPVFSRQPNLKKWVIFGLNEETVLGGVRASAAPQASIQSRFTLRLAVSKSDSLKLQTASIAA